MGSKNLGLGLDIRVGFAVALRSVVGRGRGVVEVNMGVVVLVLVVEEGMSRDQSWLRLSFVKSWYLRWDLPAGFAGTFEVGGE